ncbi:MAG: leucine-rich repeat domain-containing protein [Alistipes sp.]|nr:leucine-rich repeat domain-containing protein [Alistipes sp.]
MKRLLFLTILYVIAIPLFVGCEKTHETTYQSYSVVYTSTDGKVIDCGLGDDWICSNVYHNGYGVITIISPKPLTEISLTLFSGEDDSLESIIIPDGITKIGFYAFDYCSSLESVTIPDSVTSIGSGAFYSCDSLKSVTIPDSVTTIGYRAFYCCSSLTSVYCRPTTPPTGDDFMFFDNASNRKIYVPMESVEAYKIAEYWRDYADAIVGYDF